MGLRLLRVTPPPAWVAAFVARVDEVLGAGAGDDGAGEAGAAGEAAAGAAAPRGLSATAAACAPEGAAAPAAPARGELDAAAAPGAIAGLGTAPAALAVAAPVPEWQRHWQSGSASATAPASGLLARPQQAQQAQQQEAEAEEGSDGDDGAPFAPLCINRISLGKIVWGVELLDAQAHGRWKEYDWIGSALEMYS
jgi:hypothetical protein